MFNPDIHKLFKINSPVILRKPLYYALLRALSVPLQYLIDQLAAFRTQKKYDMAHTAQIIYLEHLLNERFNADDTYEAIYITDNLDADEPIYMGNQGEEQAEVYVGNAWQASETYSTDEEVIYNNQTWISLADSNTGNTPADGSLYWEKPSGTEEPVVYAGNAGEYDGGVFFVVNISEDHHTAMGTQINEMTAVINKFKLGGINYYYNIYEVL